MTAQQFAALGDSEATVCSPVAVDLDKDGKLEIALTTLYSGVIVYNVG